MKRTLIACTTAVAIGFVTAPQSVQAGGNDVAAGVVGGLLLGAILSEAATPQQPYGPAYAPAPAPAYGVPQGQVCVQQQEVWSPRAQAYIVRNVRVPCY